MSRIARNSVNGRLNRNTFCSGAEVVPVQCKRGLRFIVNLTSVTRSVPTGGIGVTTPQPKILLAKLSYFIVAKYDSRVTTSSLSWYHRVIAKVKGVF